ncbi:hypothetical protein B0H14DRAFT_3134171 [Mycena olivaceomarginata]|nr:hypothetical protein B0H14DRAFT_3134171 [Mycena olivaceomarginata]
MHSGAYGYSKGLSTSSESRHTFRDGMLDEGALGDELAFAERACAVWLPARASGQRSNERVVRAWLGLVGRAERAPPPTRSYLMRVRVPPRGARASPPIGRLHPRWLAAWGGPATCPSRPAADRGGLAGRILQGGKQHPDRTAGRLREAVRCAKEGNVQGRACIRIVFTTPQICSAIVLEMRPASRGGFAAARHIVAQLGYYRMATADGNGMDLSDDVSWRISRVAVAVLALFWFHIPELPLTFQHPHHIYCDSGGQKRDKNEYYIGPQAAGSDGVPGRLQRRGDDSADALSGPETREVMGPATGKKMHMLGGGGMGNDNRGGPGSEEPGDGAQGLRPEAGFSFSFLVAGVFLHHGCGDNRLARQREGEGNLRPICKLKVKSLARRWMLRARARVWEGGRGSRVKLSYVSFGAPSGPLGAA